MTRQIRTLLESEIECLLKWAKLEGWNPGLDDATAFYEADPQGFFGCFVNGELASAISAVAYDEGFGFIGLYISKPLHRGKGHGKRVWDHAMAYLGDRTIGLDGVPAQQANYARMGFAQAYRTWRWSGRVSQSPSPTAAGIVALTPDLHDAIAALDKRAFPASRSAFLDSWTGVPRHALAVIRNGTLTGYGVLRRCHDGYKIGPLFAESDEDACALFAALTVASDGEPVSIDVPEMQDVFSAHLTNIGFTKSFDTTRMYKGAAPDLEQRLVYGVTTLELG
ncbi:GNAT family N-acetyltransferase [Rhizobium oryzicola]|uniref:GNAT family N-acetyltransferase n=1 Tax=Rhizobium oryzicola TaxID=1232668 RepID=A0ABT8SVA9_9HYPH|nr:GNAT family N-acetyltransferase [Rhizobium oryzicola]MDO1582079.1 GNAT family N-acetyltransferase [Rhizobium oryzicola]